ncbi:hydroxyphenylacetyl-CoA thioesterase PaaI [Phreatobacter stygius]|uniref:Hydroxyphenylacetyl-CoA thioesterase PaaI n=1 Tax=Phreatobacter stygius TaxID=1940610 RepID=A0A4D7AWL4_9HYPH|nr:hydroxyphenylacetyl-CoA thioesterase PaaI [Phreatobacter stygius]QCI63895.1 hydroxyphenylacetyl-CoA thioesterase PaaI [Phreatobacter stygius]
MKEAHAINEAAIARAASEAMWVDDQASRALGMTLVETGPGSATLTMAVTEVMTNGHGMCHGGYIFTLADSAFAFACNSHNTRTVAHHCAVTFVASAKLGDLLTATAREISRTGRSGICDATVTDQAGGVIAIFRGHSRTLGGAIAPDHPAL